MSGPWGRNVHTASPTKGRRRQSALCEGCGTTVTYYSAPRRMRCRACWSAWWDARNQIIDALLLAEFPNGEPGYDDDAARYAYIKLASKLRNNSASIPDEEILARLAARAAAA